MTPAEGGHHFEQQSDAKGLRRSDDPPRPFSHFMKYV